MITALLLSCALLSPPAAPGDSTLVNVAHLDHLSETIVLGGDSVEIVHIYAEAPDYNWVDALGAEPEGTACVDDAARAAVFYLRRYEERRDEASLRHARRLLGFVRAMQAEDGRWYNFLYADGTVNRTGRTSEQSFGWWAARGVWALGTAVRVLRVADPGAAAQCAEAFRRSLPHVEGLLRVYGSSRTVDGFAVPDWLLYSSGADATSELLLGLVEYGSVTTDSALARMIHGLCAGLLLMQDGDARRFPFGMHRSWETQWHMWGNSQSDALGAAGMLLGDRAMIGSAESEARGFYARLLIEGFQRELDLRKPQEVKRYEQIAYDVRPMVFGLLRVFASTRKPEYLTMAGLAASWFLGNNAAGLPMFDAATGRGYDGLRDSVQRNMNAGAESTVEALLTLQAIERHPGARAWLGARRIACGSGGAFLFASFTNGKGNEVTLHIDKVSGAFTVLYGERSRAFRQESDHAR